jgi:hypothetical protein
MSCPTNDLFQNLAWQFAQNRKSDCAFEYVLEDLVLGLFVLYARTDLFERSELSVLAYVLHKIIPELELLIHIQ